MVKKIPQRMCVSCRLMLPKPELMRLVQTEQGLQPDAGGKMQGRGLYLCGQASCQSHFFNLRNLSKILQRKVEQEEADALLSKLQDARALKEAAAKKRAVRKVAEEPRPVRIVKIKATDSKELESK